ncbi:hypothetical protein [Bombilactobacillus thymidiniphilus]|uniref:Uncharacterized protein n=1 Tax=Bombilactobacillus thymidiniphilus TaxID=2923363 RepID=A0ABY4PD02_9LACO|nr:hypothetical protein [Bombilactobacillus thymidiniphilus]UQS83602.1 hypothetical protein MOO47_07515 [Bombilactobacillus thymidiniphilus]UQS83645.1 hypothetical protein MOO47_00115 [Bombilactobacillus thymidiniphilus]
MIGLHIFFGVMIVVGAIATAISFQGDTAKLTKAQKFSLILTTSAIGLTIVTVISVYASIYIGLLLLLALVASEYFAFVRVVHNK